MNKRTAFKATTSAANSVAKTAEKAIVGLGRWAATDHTGVSKQLASPALYP